MAFRTIPLPLFAFCAACTTPFIWTSSALWINPVHRVVKSTIQANGWAKSNGPASATIAEAKCFGIGHAIGDDLVHASVDDPAFLIDSTGTQGHRCQ